MQIFRNIWVAINRKESTTLKFQRNIKDSKVEYQLNTIEINNAQLHQLIQHQEFSKPVKAPLSFSSYLSESSSC